jgi:hypothetical protein
VSFQQHCHAIATSKTQKAQPIQSWPPSSKLQAYGAPHAMLVTKQELDNYSGNDSKSRLKLDAAAGSSKNFGEKC